MESELSITTSGPLASSTRENSELQPTKDTSWDVDPFLMVIALPACAILLVFLCLLTVLLSCRIKNKFSSREPKLLYYCSTADPNQQFLVFKMHPKGNKYSNEVIQDSLSKLPNFCSQKQGIGCHGNRINNEDNNDGNVEECLVSSLQRIGQSYVKHRHHKNEKKSQSLHHLHSLDRKHVPGCISSRLRSCSEGEIHTSVTNEETKAKDPLVFLPKQRKQNNAAKEVVLQTNESTLSKRTAQENSSLHSNYTSGTFSTDGDVVSGEATKALGMHKNAQVLSLSDMSINIRSCPSSPICQRKVKREILGMQDLTGMPHFYAGSGVFIPLSASESHLVHALQEKDSEKIFNRDSKIRSPSGSYAVLAYTMGQDDVDERWEMKTSL